MLACLYAARLSYRAPHPLIKPTPEKATEEAASGIFCDCYGLHVAVRPVSQEAVALRQPCHAKCDKRQRFARQQRVNRPEQSLRSRHVQADNQRIAHQDHRAAHRVDDISVLFASSASYSRRALAKRAEAEIREDEKHLRRKNSMDRIQLQLKRRVHIVPRVHRRAERNSQSKKPSEVSSD